MKHQVTTSLVKSCPSRKTDRRRQSQKRNPYGDAFVYRLMQEAGKSEPRPLCLSASEKLPDSLAALRERAWEIGKSDQSLEWRDCTWCQELIDQAWLSPKSVNRQKANLVIAMLRLFADRYAFSRDLSELVTCLRPLKDSMKANEIAESYAIAMDLKECLKV